MKHEVSCAGCGKVKECFFSEGFDIKLEDWGRYNRKTNSAVDTYVFCNFRCLELWLKKPEKERLNTKTQSSWRVKVIAEREKK